MIRVNSVAISNSIFKKLKEQNNNLEKSKTVLEIKLETALSENDSFTGQNEKLSEKVTSLSASISKAETRSETVSSIQHKFS